MWGTCGWPGHNSTFLHTVFPIRDPVSWHLTTYFHMWTRIINLLLLHPTYVGCMYVYRNCSVYTGIHSTPKSTLIVVVVQYSIMIKAEWLNDSFIFWFETCKLDLFYVDKVHLSLWASILTYVKARCSSSRLPELLWPAMVVICL